MTASRGLHRNTLQEWTVAVAAPYLVKVAQAVGREERKLQPYVRVTTGLHDGTAKHLVRVRHSAGPLLVQKQRQLEGVLACPNP